MDSLQFLAPVSGPMLPIEEVPDPVFAEKMVGDGVSIDPVTSTLLAPCDAEILSIHPSGHAVTLQTPERVELILHIGLDTVTLRGEGFLPLKKKGDFVRAGDALIEFAADYVATHAPSLLTQMVISSADRVVVLKRRSGYAEAGRDVVLEAMLASEDSPIAPVADSRESLFSSTLRVRNPTGLHARPAAVLASTARKFRSQVLVKCGTREANAKSVTGLMALEISAGEDIVLAASGDDARAALDALVPLVEAGLGEAGEDANHELTSDVEPTAMSGLLECFDRASCLCGAGASPGLAIGRIVQLTPQELPTIQPTGTPDEERQKLDRALKQAKLQLESLSSPTAGSTVQAGIFRAHLELLDDPDLVEFTLELIADGTGAAAAWQRAFSRLAERLAAARSDLFAQRAADVRDVGRRVLRLLAGVNGGTPTYPDDAIIVAHDLTPSDAAAFDRSRVRGFCTVTGGKTSHVAILARSLGIPAVAGIDPKALEIAPRTQAILDGTNGMMMVEPTEQEIAVAEAAIEQQAARRRASAATAHQPAITTDGIRIEVAVNVGSLTDLRDVVEFGADGVGLLRSEFLFMDRPTPPTEDEQYEAYSRVIDAFGPERRIIVRTLDVGGDKPLSYLPLPREDNPFLGIRGIRVSAQRPDLFRTQLRAILRASRHGRVHVMFPMVTGIEEWTAAKCALDEERAALGADAIPAGIMVEVPAVALMSDRFATEVDFLSIGTNDLTQYTLAMDRGHPALAAQVDALHPAVLQLIAQTANAARVFGKWVGVCGALASEEVAVPILLGLGVTELSVSGPSVPSIKARVRSLRMSECRSVANAALKAPSAVAVRALVRS